MIVAETWLGAVAGSSLVSGKQARNQFLFALSDNGNCQVFAASQHAPVATGCWTGEMELRRWMRDGNEVARRRGSGRDVEI